MKDVSMPVCLSHMTFRSAYGAAFGAGTGLLVQGHPVLVLFSTDHAYRVLPLINVSSTVSSVWGAR